MANWSSMLGESHLWNRPQRIWLRFARNCIIATVEEFFTSELGNHWVMKRVEILEVCYVFDSVTEGEIYLVPVTRFNNELPLFWEGIGDSVFLNHWDLCFILCNIYVYWFSFLGVCSSPSQTMPQVSNPLEEINKAYNILSQLSCSIDVKWLIMRSDVVTD